MDEGCEFMRINRKRCFAQREFVALQVRTFVGVGTTEELHA